MSRFLGQSSSTAKLWRRERMFGKNKSAPIPTDPIGSLSAVGRTTAREAKVFAADVEQTSIIAANFATRVEDFAAQLIALCDALDALDAIVKRD